MALPFICYCHRELTATALASPAEDHRLHSWQRHAIRMRSVRFQTLAQLLNRTRWSYSPTQRLRLARCRRYAKHRHIRGYDVRTERRALASDGATTCCKHPVSVDTDSSNALAPPRFP